jgi:hypothetical protein
MLTVGVAVFATFSGFIATTLLAPRKQVLEAPTSVDELTALLDKQEQTAAEIRAKVAQLQKASAANLAR